MNTYKSINKNTQNNHTTNYKSWQKAIYVAIGFVVGAYLTGNTIESRRLSRELEPLRTEFREIVSEGGLDYSFDYDGRLEELVTKKNQFAKDNGARPRAWKSRITAGSTKNISNTPRPMVYNPFNWGQEINNDALGKYKR